MRVRACVLGLGWGWEVIICTCLLIPLADLIKEGGSVGNRTRNS